MSETIRDALGDLLPGEAILPGPASASWPADTPPPAAVLAPGTEEQIAAVLERASQEGWRVLPAGFCTWLGGNGLPEAELVLSTRNLREVATYEPADLTFTAGAGIPWSDLRRLTGVNGQWLPLDSPGLGAGSLGGAVATGSSGPLRYAYGAPRDHVLGVTLVSGDGRVLRWGGRVVKNVAGFDVTRLVIGSYGALGVVTSVSARLFPLPESDTTLIVQGPTAEDLLPSARAMALSPLPLAAVELLDPLGWVWPRRTPGRGPWDSGVEGVGGEGKGGAEGAALVLRILGSEDQVREMEDRVTKDLSGVARSGGRGFLVLRGPDSADFHEALGEWEEGLPLVMRMALLPSLLEALLGEARELAARFGALAVSGSVGSGTLRVSFPRLQTKGEGGGDLIEALKGLRRRLEAARGSLVLSQGPAAILKEIGVLGTEGPEARLMRGLKKKFDPAGILSPGRFGL
jgi:glycolate oxidase FAD binding subunit